MIPVQDRSDIKFREGIRKEIQPIPTYKMHIDEERVQGLITEELEAVRQMCYKCINTEKGEYVIYPTFGVKKKDLFFKPKNFAYVKLKYRIREALMLDDRVTDVVDFVYHKDKSVRNDLVMSFTVLTIYGTWTQREVIRLG